MTPKFNKLVEDMAGPGMQGIPPGAPPPPGIVRDIKDVDMIDFVDVFHNFLLDHGVAEPAKIEGGNDIHKLAPYHLLRQKFINDLWIERKVPFDNSYKIPKDFWIKRDRDDKITPWGKMLLRLGGKIPNNPRDLT